MGQSIAATVMAFVAFGYLILNPNSLLPVMAGIIIAGLAARKAK